MGEFDWMLKDMRAGGSYGPMSEAKADEIISLAVGSLREGAYCKVRTENWEKGGWESYG